MKRLLMLGCGVVLVFSLMSPAAPAWETQLTFTEEAHHALDNNLNFSADSQWLVYDTRAFSGSIRNCLALEKVNINTGEIVTVYEAPNPVTDLGPGLGAVSFIPNTDQVVAIHGLPTSTGLRYEGYRRFGAIISPTDGTGTVQIADARDVTYPYTAGALRG